MFLQLFQAFHVWTIVSTIKEGGRIFKLCTTTIGNCLLVDLVSPPHMWLVLISDYLWWEFADFLELLFPIFYQMHTQTFFHIQGSVTPSGTGDSHTIHTKLFLNWPLRWLIKYLQNLTNNYFFIKVLNWGQGDQMTCEQNRPKCT
jgi:predicted small integral membrane protein